MLLASADKLGIVKALKIQMIKATKRIFAN